MIVACVVNIHRLSNADRVLRNAASRIIWRMTRAVVVGGPWRRLALTGQLYLHAPRICHAMENYSRKIITLCVTRRRHRYAILMPIHNLRASMLITIPRWSHDERASELYKSENRYFFYIYIRHSDRYIIRQYRIFPGEIFFTAVHCVAVAKRAREKRPSADKGCIHGLKPSFNEPVVVIVQPIAFTS